MTWNEAQKTLTIGDRKGSFPGMLETRTFRIVWAGTKDGTGVEPAKKAVEVSYSGKEIKVKK
jgi:alpha-D-xyloside xylohydrolase